MNILEAKKIKKILNDPVKWAQIYVRTFDKDQGTYVPWIARWYQAEMLRDDSLKKVARCGRRTGKCLPGWTKITDPITGERKTIKELYNKGQANVISMNKDHRLIHTDTNIVMRNGIKPVYKVILESGKSLDATGNHPLYTKKGWKDIDNLKLGEAVATPAFIKCICNNKIKLKEIDNIIIKDKIPNYIFTLNKRLIAYFICKIFNINTIKEINNKTYYNDNNEVLQGIQHLLLRFKIQSIIRNNKIKVLEFNTKEEIVWEKIISIKYIGHFETYDLTIPEVHNFLAEDIITHNTETMCIDGLHRTSKKKNIRILYVTPYENQVRLIFMRLKELIYNSPMLKETIKSFTKNPYKIEFSNGSAILGFTTGASSGNAGASIRGQRADYIYIDEVDYLGENDFDAVTTIAAERDDIGIFLSSTPTGKRSAFYKACTDPKMGYTEHHHPSMHNPNWGPKMEAEFKAQLSDEGYVHEILAEFGTQEKGVFDKIKIDMATQKKYYAYDKLDYFQIQKIKEKDIIPEYYIYDKNNRPPYNPFRTMGVDWDKFGASSSIIILDYDVNMKNFIVIKRIEVPRSEYEFDTAVNLIIELNDLYNPSWIFVDAGAGEYQIERLHIYGDKNPTSGLKYKLKRCNFKQNLEIEDPITREIVKSPLKQVMVSQLQIAIERNSMVFSPFDEVLYKQLIDYEVVRKNQNGDPIFTNVNEHFVDALGLAFLAFVLYFKELTNVMKDPVNNCFKIEHSRKKFGEIRYKNLWNSINNTFSTSKRDEKTDDDLPGDKPVFVRVSSNNNAARSWNRRTSSNFSRSIW